MIELYDVSYLYDAFDCMLLSCKKQCNHDSTIKTFDTWIVEKEINSIFFTSSEIRTLLIGTERATTWEHADNRYAILVG